MIFQIETEYASLPNKKYYPDITGDLKYVSFDLLLIILHISLVFKVQNNLHGYVLTTPS